MSHEFSARRILVIGSSGAGKSTVAALLGERLGLSVTSLDRLYYEPGWKARSSAQFREEVARLVSGDEWIIDGDFSDTYDLRFPRAEAIIDLAYSRSRCLLQALKRLAFAAREGRPDLPVGCRECFDLSLLRWIWRYPIDNRPRINDALQRSGGNALQLTFTSPRELNRWINNTVQRR